MDNQIDTLGDLIDRNAGRRPQGAAVVSGGKKLTFEELKTDADRMARAFLALGVKKGDRIALLMDNRPEWLAIDFGLAKIGAVLVPINIRYRQYELNFLLNHAKPSILIMIDSFAGTDFIEMMLEICPELKASRKENRNKNRAEKLHLAKFPSLEDIFCLSDGPRGGFRAFEALTERSNETRPEDVVSAQRRVAAEDIAQILYTSGTTAFPKGVILSHANLCRNGKNIADRLRIVDTDKFWLPIPFFFSFGCANAVMTAYSAGACLVLQQYFDPGEALRLIERERCTVMYAMPTMFLPMLEDPDLEQADISSLRTGMVIGSPDQIGRVIDRMGVTDLNTGYGMTETTAVCCLTSPDDSRTIRTTTVGKPFPGGSIKIKDPVSGRPVPDGQEGEIRVKGYNVTWGYYEDPVKTAESFDDENFLKTGDIGVLTSGGNFQFKGRYKDMLKTSGINVSTLEVEGFLETHPDVKEAHVVGVPDPIKQEVGAAFIRLSQNSTCSSQDVLEYCRGKIASFKIPKYIEFQSEFPLTGSGKVKKYVLKEQMIKKLNL
jgi:fatty-acyl-CoA synthase